MNIAAAVVAAAMLSVASAGAAEPVRIDVDGKLVSIDITASVPLRSVLQLLGGKLNAAVEANHDLGTTGLMRIERVRLDAVLHALAPGRSFVVQHRSDSGAVSLIRMIGGNSRADTPPLVLQAEVEPDPVPPVDARNARAIALRDVVKLSYSPGAASTRALEALARDAGNTEIRKTALNALVSVANKQASAFLATRLAQDASAEVRVAAAEALMMADKGRAQALIRSAIVREIDGDAKLKLRDILKPGL